MSDLFWLSGMNQSPNKQEYTYTNIIDKKENIAFTKKTKTLLHFCHMRRKHHYILGP